MNREAILYYSPLILILFINLKLLFSSAGLAKKVAFNLILVSLISIGAMLISPPGGFGGLFVLGIYIIAGVIFIVIHSFKIIFSKDANDRSSAKKVLLAIFFIIGSLAAYYQYKFVDNKKSKHAKTSQRQLLGQRLANGEATLKDAYNDCKGTYHSTSGMLRECLKSYQWYYFKQSSSLENCLELHKEWKDFLESKKMYRIIAPRSCVSKFKSSIQSKNELMDLCTIHNSRKGKKRFDYDCLYNGGLMDKFLSLQECNQYFTSKFHRMECEKKI